MPPETPQITRPGRIKLSILEYNELPNDGKRYQILDGELVATPAPFPRHQEISKRIGFILYATLERRGLGKIVYAPLDVVLDRHNIVQPDLIYIRKARLGIIGPKNIEGPPDLVVEILSPSSRRTDVETKSALYARFAIPSYWIVDPRRDRLEIFRLEGEAYLLERAWVRPAVARTSALPDVAIRLAEVFGE